MNLNTCPCCSGLLLRHVRQRGIYWFCTSCRQEMMPLVGEKKPVCNTLKVRALTATAAKA